MKTVAIYERLDLTRPKHTEDPLWTNLSLAGVKLRLVEELEERGDESQNESRHQDVENTGHVRQLQTARRLLLQELILGYRPISDKDNSVKKLSAAKL